MLFNNLYAVLAEFDPLKPIQPAPLFTFSIGSHTITVSNHMFMITLAAVLLLIFLSIGTYPKRLIPKGLQNLIEMICVYLRDQLARPSLGEYTDKYISFVWTIFFFVLTMNLLNMVPLESIIYLITRRPNHFGGTPTANIWVTGGLAAVTFFAIHIAGIKEKGLFQYIITFAPKVPWPILILIYPLEIVSAFIKPAALAIRLFANMLAGHILLAILIGLIFVFKSFIFAGASVLFSVATSFLELLVAFVQAYIFTLLSTLFISFAVSHEH